MECRLVGSLEPGSLNAAQTALNAISGAPPRQFCVEEITMVPSFKASKADSRDRNGRGAAARPDGAEGFHFPTLVSLLQILLAPIYRFIREIADEAEDDGSSDEESPGTSGRADPWEQAWRILRYKPDISNEAKDLPVIVR